LITFPLPTAIIYCPIKFGADTFIIIIIIIIKYIYIAQDREKLQMQWVDTFICCAAAEILPFYKIHLVFVGGTTGPPTKAHTLVTILSRLA